MQERLRRLSAVNEAGRAMSAILDLDQLLDRILSLAHQVFDFANCAVLLLDAQASELFILKARGYDPEVVRSFRAGPGQGITGSVLIHGKPIIVEDVHQDPRYIRGVAGAHSEIAAPLIVDEMVIGVLDAETPTPRTFGDEDLEFFELFAHEAATAIHNARLHYQVALHAKILEQRLEQMGGILGCSSLLTDGTPVDQATTGILETALEATSCEACSVLLLRDGETHLQEYRRLGQQLFALSDNVIDGISGGICQALRLGEAVAVASLSQEPEPYDGFPAQGCELIAPLFDCGRPFGLLLGYRSVGDPPGEMDLAVFSGFATLLALNLTRSAAALEQADEREVTLTSLD